MVVPVQVEVPPSEWNYVYPLKEIARYMKSRKSNATRHDVTRWLSIVEDYAAQNLGRAAAVARILEDFERRFGFSNEEERDHVAEMVKRVVARVYAVKRKEPEKLSQFIKTLRNVILGVFFGYIDPVLPQTGGSPQEST